MWYRAHRDMFAGSAENDCGRSDGDAEIGFDIHRGETEFG